MYPGFVKQVGEVTELIRKRDLLELGKHELTRLRLVQKRAGPGPQYTAAQLGETLKDLVVEVVEAQLKPPGEEDVDRVDWRRYLLLRDYIIRGERWTDVTSRLGISQTLFFITKKDAIELLADKLWELEQKARQEPTKVKHNLPRPLYREFVRRVDDEGRDLVDKIVEQLTIKRAWVASIRGFSGSGKTTLALEVARECVAREYFDAVIWTSARPKDPDFVASLENIVETVGKELGERKVLTIDDLDEKIAAVKNLLTETSCLLVIDNTETLSDERHAEIYSFVRDLPSPTKVLLTSRERGRASELEWVTTLFGMNKTEALEFMKGQCEDRGIYGIREEDLLYIWEMTAGLPAAMQMAIGQMATHGYAAQEVIQTGLAGEEILNYLLEGAYNKLDMDQKKILHVMPLFAEPAPQPAIAEASAIKGTHLAVGLGRLYSLFLVNKHDSDHYDILAPTRSFLMKEVQGGAMLGDEPATAFLTKAYCNLANYYLAFLKDKGHADRLAIIKEQRENILAVMEGCYQNEQWKLVADLVSVVGRSLGILGYWNERILWGKRAMEAAERLNDRESYAWFAIHDVGWAYLCKGEAEAGRKMTARGLDVAMEVDCKRAKALALRNLGWIIYRRENYKEALQYYQDSLTLWEQEGSPDWIAVVKSSLGKAKYRLGELEEARRLLWDALSTRRLLGEPAEISENLSDLARVALAEGKLEEAIALSEQSKAIAQELPKPAESYAYALKCRAEIEYALGNADEARGLIKRAQQTYDKLGAKHMVAYTEKMLERFQSEIEEPIPDP